MIISVTPYYHLPIAVYTCDKKGYLTSCNKSAISLWGRNPDLATEKWSGASKAFDCNGTLMAREEYPAAIVTREKKIISNAEFILGRPDGSTRNVLVSSVPTFDESGNFTGTINTLLDITDQKKQEERQAMMTSIIASSDDAIIGKSLEGIITSWNGGAKTLFGYTEAEALGRHISLIIPPEKIDEEKFIIGKIKKGERIEHFETYRVGKDGKHIPISLTISPIKNAKGIIIGASKIARDISRQKAADELFRNYAACLETQVQERTQLLTKTVKELERARKELDGALTKERELGQLKSRFVSMASHEFRTPLSAIRLSCSLVEKYSQSYDTANTAKHIGKIKSAVSNMTNILNDFLSLEKLDAGKVKVELVAFDIVKFSEEIKEEMQMIAKAGQTIVYQHTGTYGVMTLDPNLLHNCIINLISNAIKYSPDDALVEFDTEVKGNQYLITVRDHGIGIPEDEQKHLFEAFFRANNTGTIQGTGLGLNIVSRYTSLMNGEVTFKSEPGKGTCFTLIFPEAR